MEKENKSLATTEKKPSKIMTFIKNHKTFFIMLLIIIIISVWALIKLKITNNQHEKEKTTLITQYETQIDSIKTADTELTVKVFSWAIRSEMMRDNLEQVNQFFISFVKENPTVSKISLINPNSGKVLVSTDKIEEKNTVTDPIVLRTNKVTWQGEKMILAPIMGLNEKEGILQINFK